MTARGAVIAALLFLIGASTPAVAQPLPLPPTADVDACSPTRSAAISLEERTRRARDHDQRGRVLYGQGDYLAAIDEFVAAYCTQPRPFLLYNLGQTFERLVAYEKAVAYFERYIRESKGLPQEEAERRKAIIRVGVLRGLPARVSVATSPPRAEVTILSARGVVARGRSNDKPLLVTRGRYSVRVELPGYEPITREIEARIGRPYSYNFPLTKLRGLLRVSTRPENARIFLNQELVGFGRYEGRIPTGTYKLTVEATNRPAVVRTVEITAGKTSQVDVHLPKPPRSGRTELLIAGSLGAAGLGAGTLLSLSPDRKVPAIIAGVAGAGLGLGGAYFGIPRDIPEGQASYLIATPLITAAEFGLLGAYLCERTSLTFGSGDDCTIAGLRVAQVGGVAGIFASAFTAKLLDPNPGDVALVNSGALWGTVAGFLFGNLFENDERVNNILSLAGLNVGLGVGVLLATRADVSRGRTAIIDLGGLGGLVAGISIADIGDTRSDLKTNAALVGIGSGLILATYLTRHMDDPKVGTSVRPRATALIDKRGHAVPGVAVDVTW